MAKTKKRRKIAPKKPRKVFGKRTAKKTGAEVLAGMAWPSVDRMLSVAAYLIDDAMNWLCEPDMRKEFAESFAVGMFLYDLVEWRTGEKIERHAPWEGFEVETGEFADECDTGRIFFNAERRELWIKWERRGVETPWDAYDIRPKERNVLAGV